MTLVSRFKAHYGRRADDGVRSDDAGPTALRPEPQSAHIRFFHTDHFGTPLQVIDIAGKTHWQANPDDWRGGNRGQTTETAPNTPHRSCSTSICR